MDEMGLSGLTTGSVNTVSMGLPVTEETGEVERKVRRT